MVNEPLPQNIRAWGVGCHLVGAIAALIGTSFLIPFLFVLLPYIVWQIGRDRHDFIDTQGRAAINFLLSMSIYGVVLSVLSTFIAFLTCSVVLNAVVPAGGTGSSEQLLFGWILFGWLAGFALFGVLQVSVMIFAGIKAYQGQSYHYPFTLRFLAGDSIQ